jgi:hypothetical protein
MLIKADMKSPDKKQGFLREDTGISLLERSSDLHFIGGNIGCRGMCDDSCHFFKYFL